MAESNPVRCPGCNVCKPINVELETLRRESTGLRPIKDSLQSRLMKIAQFGSAPGERDEVKREYTKKSKELDVLDTKSEDLRKMLDKHHSEVCDIKLSCERRVALCDSLGKMWDDVKLIGVEGGIENHLIAIRNKDVEKLAKINDAYSKISVITHKQIKVGKEIEEHDAKCHCYLKKS